MSTTLRIHAGLTGPPRALNECGAVVAGAERTAFDHDVCGRPEREHLRAREYRAPWVRTFPATHIHRLTLPAGRECWTLVIVFRPVRDWGFWHAGSFIPWRRYVSGTGSAIANSRKACP